MLINNANITGSLIVVGGTVLSGSLTVSGSTLNNLSASYALTASYVASVANLSTSRIASGSVTASVNINSGSFTVTSGSSTFLFVSSSGNVGIGFNNPTAELHISGTSGALLQTVSGSTTGLFVSSSGQVGIGTVSLTNANTALHVLGSGTTEIIRMAGATSTSNPYFSWYQSTTRRGYIQLVNSGYNLSLVSEFGGINFWTGNNSNIIQRVTITSSGSVGINKTTSNANLDISGSTLISGSLTVSGSTTLTGSLAVSSLTGSGVRYLVTDDIGNVTAQTASAAIKNSQVYTASAGQTTFTVTNGYTTGLVDVYLNGTKLLDGPEYTDTSGTNIVLATGSFAGDIVEIVTYQPASGVTNNSLRQLTSFTATEGQTTFSASYVPGLLDVFYNGSRLNTIEYTAANGSSITLATGSAAGDLVDVLVYSYQVGAFSGIGGTGTANQIAYWNTTNSITGSSNFIVSSSVLTISGSRTTITGSVLISGSSTAFAVNNSALFVSSSGNIGIGTINPINPPGFTRFLNISGTDAAITISNTNGTAKNWTLGALESGNFIIADGTTERIRISAIGNVGIGTNSPVETAGYIFTTINGISGSGYITRVNGTTALYSYSNASESRLAEQRNLPLIFETNGSEKMRLTASGRLAIGRTVPGTALSVAGQSEAWQLALSTDTGEGGVIGSPSANVLAFGNWAGTERVRITNSELKLNHTNGSFAYYLYLNRNSTQDGGILLGRNNSLDWQIINGSNGNCEWYSYGTSSTVLTVRRADGTIFTTPTYNNTYGNAANMFISSDGAMGRSTSSLKYKKNVLDYTKGLAEVMQLRPVSYTSKNPQEEGQTFAGLIAEEVHDLGLTEFVQYAEDGTPDALAYQNMIALLAKAIQEQQAKITALEEKLERNNIQ